MSELVVPRAFVDREVVITTIEVGDRSLHLDLKFKFPETDNKVSLTSLIESAGEQADAKQVANIIFEKITDELDASHVYVKVTENMGDRKECYTLTSPAKKN